MWSTGVLFLALAASAHAAFLPRSNTGSCATKTISFKDTYLYDLDRLGIPAPTVTSAYGVKVDASVYIIDGQLNTKAQIQSLQQQGKTVICDISAGSWEPTRPDALDLNPECFCGKGVSYDNTTHKCTGKGANQNKLDGWDEWYLDIRNPGCYSQVKAWQSKRIQSFISKGCDGIDPDNVDEYSNVQALNVTADDEVDYLMWLSQTARKNSLLVDLKNSDGLLVNSNGSPTKYQGQLVDAFDFNVIEQCHQYGDCKNYSSFLDVGKPQIQLEYNTDGYKTTSCPTLERGQCLLVYQANDLNSSHITLDCKDTSY